MNSVEQALWDAIQGLSPEQKTQVMTFVQQLEASKGEPLVQLIQHAEEIAFPPDDLAEIRQFIEATFEQVDGDELDGATFAS